ncbi:MAG: ATP-dependent DNA helicase, partial [Verrucomicrobia bacterium]|nr:ATP-dependent DNA helicase [Verrucomicrobiota bacterium]
MIRLNEAMDPHSGAEPPRLDVVAAIRRIFAQGGLLEQHLGLQFRPQQAEMAIATAAAMAGEQTLFAEAGTGVGKSLAYLLPGLLQAVSAKRPFLVSTHTIALQQQIETKDLPLCRKLFATDPVLKECAGFRHTVLLGRANYLCGTRLRQALETRTELFPSAQQEELQRIADWAEQSVTGLRQELEPPPDPEVWDWVHADAHACNQRNCTTDACPFRRARAAIRRAHLVIVNHSLLFALLAAGQSPEASVPGVLLPEDFVVLDEAHVLPAVATDYFGQRISEEGLRRQLQKLFHLRRGKRRGLLPSLRAHDLCLAVQKVQERADSFFEEVRTTFLRSGRPFRFREPEWMENPVDTALRQLLHGLARREERLEEGPRRDELEGVRKRLQGYRDGMAEVLQLGDPESVYWTEAGGRKGSIVHLRSAPLSVAEPLRRALFSRRTSAVLTSATLAEGADMTSFQERVGAPDTEARRVASPFDYSLQMEILLHTSAPEPNSADHSLCTDFLATEIGILAGQMEGGSLVLFTSYR